MGDSLSKIVTGIFEDLVIDAVNCSKNSGEKGKALRKGRPSSGGLTCGAKFGDVAADGGKGGKAVSVEGDIGAGKAVGVMGGKV